MIRKVTKEDARAIADIYNEYVLNSVISFETEAVPVSAMQQRIEMISAQYPYYVYEEDGKVLGYCYAHAWKERAAYKHTYETTIYLDKASQGKSIGRELLRHLIEECRQAGAHVLVACITAENEKSIRFHQRFGFKQSAHFQQVGMKFGRWLDVVDYQLLL